MVLTGSVQKDHVLVTSIGVFCVRYWCVLCSILVCSVFNICVVFYIGVFCVLYWCVLYWRVLCCNTKLPCDVHWSVVCSTRHISIEHTNASHWLQAGWSCFNARQRQRSACLLRRSPAMGSWGGGTEFVPGFVRSKAW
jgi:hypothetical protein